MTRTSPLRLLGFLCLLLAGWAMVLAGGAMPTAADEPAASDAPRPKYIRISRDDSDEPLALQTAIVRFVPADDASGGVQVDLVGAVHVGEKSYYEALNKQFEGYDVVLYELVAPEGTRVPKGGKPSGHPVAMLQNGLKGMLELEHQLELVDYTKENMVHADMSPDDFAKSMEERNESFFGMFFRMMGQAMAQQSVQKNRTSDFDLLAALFDPDRAGSMKRIMAEQFESLDGVMGALEGPDGSTIITERNKVALEKLAEQINGRQEEDCHLLRSRASGRHGKTPRHGLRSETRRRTMARRLESRAKARGSQGETGGAQESGPFPAPCSAGGGQPGCGAGGRAARMLV